MRTSYARELRLVYRKTDPPVPLVERPQVTDPATAIKLLADLLGGEGQEVAGVLLLDTKGRLIAWHEVSRGNLDATALHPGIVFRAAIAAGAPRLIVAHTHPSGDATPSSYDDQVTKRLRAGADLLGIQMDDHVIIGLGSGESWSYKQKGSL